MLADCLLVLSRSETARHEAFDLTRAQSRTEPQSHLECSCDEKRKCCFAVGRENMNSDAVLRLEGRIFQPACSTT
jgi:hypothetical protein